MSTDIPQNSPLTGDLAASSGSSAVLSDIPRYPQSTSTTASRVRAPGIKPLNIVLFLITLVTTTMAGAILGGADFSLLHPLSSIAGLYVGLSFSIPLMGILLAHEMGHYVTARRNRVDCSAPYFIPSPYLLWIPLVGPIFLIGTFGAFIRLRAMPRSRRVMFDIGAAGPWAGMLVAVPVLIVGLLVSKVGPLDKSVGGLQLGNSLLFYQISRWVLHVDPNAVSVDLSPIAFAGWLGFLVTMLNLLPVGQLDGGHVIYALFGRWHRIISRLFVFGFLLMTAYQFFFNIGSWAGWMFWVVLLFVLGLGHPVTADSETPLDPMRRFAAWATIALFIVTFSPEPLSFVAPSEPQQQEEKLYSVHSIPHHAMRPHPTTGAGKPLPQSIAL